MAFSYILLIPAIISIGWAIHTKYQQRKIADMFILLFSEIAVVVNAVLVYRMMLSDIPAGLHIVQIAASSIIVPLAYTYFSRQVAKTALNVIAATIMWCLAALSLVPEIIITNPFVPFEMPTDGLKPFAFYVLSHGKKVFAIYTGDLIIIAQSLILFSRIIIFTNSLRNHNLHLNGKIYSFIGCLMLALIFIIMISCMTYDDLRSPMGAWFYFGVYSGLSIFSSCLIVKEFDLSPIKTEQGEAIEDMNIYVHQQFKSMAIKLKSLMEENHLYCEPQLSADNVIALLHTNRTYFSQLLAQEWGMSFSEYLSSLRIKHVEMLLQGEALPISAIAAQSGFADASYMTRKFKAKHGVTPSEWRKKHFGEAKSSAETN